MPLTLPFFTHMEMHNMLLYGTSEFIKGFSGKIYITSCESGQRTQSSHYRGERYEVTLWTVTQILSVRFRILLGIRYTSRFFSLLSLCQNSQPMSELQSEWMLIFKVLSEKITEVCIGEESMCLNVTCI